MPVSEIDPSPTRGRFSGLGSNALQARRIGGRGGSVQPLALTVFVSRSTPIYPLAHVLPGSTARRRRTLTRRGLAAYLGRAVDCNPPRGLPRWTVCLMVSTAGLGYSPSGLFEVDATRAVHQLSRRLVMPGSRVRCFPWGGDNEAAHCRRQRPEGLWDCVVHCE